MNIRTFIIAATALLIASCSSESAAPTATAVLLPTQPPLPSATVTVAATETPLPTETASLVPAQSDVFGAIPLNSVQAFSIEPVAKATFDQALQSYVTSGTVQEFRVDRVSVFPSSEGGLIAEITYSLRTDQDLWPEDFGIPDGSGWIIGKCSRFDLIATETEHQLTNKRLCS